VELTYCSKENELEQVLRSVHKAVEAGADLSDIAVLVRSNRTGSEIAQYLIDNGITVITDEALKVKSSITVRRLVSLMSYVDNPDNTVNGFLAESLDVALPEGCRSLVDMAESLLRSIKQNEEDGFRPGEAVYVQSFMDCLQDYVSSNGNNLRGFLKYWEGEDPSISSPSSGQSVRVMTIHKSKGLDFPYVIIPYAENIVLYKADKNWCVPDLSGTSLEGIAEGVYDVTLSSGSESTLFADHYRNERFLQQVDNINTIYVAMTRAALGLHVIARTPSMKFLIALDAGGDLQYADFSQMLYHYAEQSALKKIEEDESVSFQYGDVVDFKAFAKKDDAEVGIFPVAEGNEYPSIPLNPQGGDDQTDVRERGRLKFSADSIDFFSEDGQAGIASSNRIKGVVLHDILSEVICAEDLADAVMRAVKSGVLTSDEAEEVETLLAERISEVMDKGWFPSDRKTIMNEVSIIDTDGQVYRPDRVVVTDEKVLIVDYKFGEHYRKYERQMMCYADLWRRMGHAQVQASLWYVHTGEIMEIAK
jgi:ATP-dependent exoDNAse (exonuclease V) beta subunit